MLRLHLILIRERPESPDRFLLVDICTKVLPGPDAVEGHHSWLENQMNKLNRTLEKFEVQATKLETSPTMNTVLNPPKSQTFPFASPTSDRPPPDAGLKTVADLVRSAQSGDRDAFGELFERYRDGIFALAMRRVRNADEAEELTQDVFIQAMQKIAQLRVPEAFGGWLRQIVHRMAINRMTRRQSALAVEPETLEATCVAKGSPDGTAEDREQAEVIRKCVAKLGQMDQQTLIAFYLQSKSLVEMSNQFDAPIGTIKRRLHVARKRLAKEMDWVQAV